MDRTTHSLLSPSSIANRLNIIEVSRRRANSTDGNVEPLSFATSYARSDCGSVASHASNTSAPLRRETGGGGSLAGYPIHEDGGAADFTVCSIEDSERAGAAATASSQSEAGETANLSSLLKSCDASLDPVIASNDSERSICKEAMSFIPQIETMVHGEGDENNSARLENRIALLTPILTACYTRHGGAALVAVDGLTSLLTETDFFSDDVDLSDDSDNESSTRLTLLDLAVQCVSDVATSGSQETTFASCVDFVERAVKYSHGQLSTRTIGFVLRFYLFVFYFDASIPRKNFRWPPAAWRPPNMYDEEDFPMLFDPREEQSVQHSYLPGGAPQASVLALKELISLSIVRLGKISVSDMFILAQPSSGCQSSLSDSSVELKDAYAPILESILTIVDKAVDHVDRANFAQLALYQIHRSGGSELFWHDMLHVCGQNLFSKDQRLSNAGKDIYIMIFAMLQQLIKISSAKLRATAHYADLSPKDIASKLLSLELLLHFLEFWSDEQEAVSGMKAVKEAENIPSIDTLAFVVRRTVVPCLLWNTSLCLENPQVFRRVIRILSELWCSPIYRKHCKVELGMLFEHFALRLLELGPQCTSSTRFELRPGQGQLSLLPQQVELIGEIKNWFSNDPKDIIEIFLNYDTDVSSQISGPIQLLQGTRWQIFQRLCAGLSSIAEECGELIGHQILQNQCFILAGVDRSKDAKAETLSKDSLNKDEANSTEIREAARVLRKTSLEAMAQIVKTLAISAGAATGQEFMSLLLSWSPLEPSSLYESSLSVSEGHASHSDGKNSAMNEGDDGVLTFWRSAIVADQNQRAAGAVPTAKESFETAFEIAQQKNLKKAVEYLIACNALAPSARDIANFLRIHKERFDSVDLGLYLSESGQVSSETEHWNSIRMLFVRAISFNGMNVVEGLRHFLTSSGFRLPGEAQRIDRIMNTFAQCYFEDNAGDQQHCPFKDQDTVYVIVFAIIMLNTDLHKSDSARRKTHKKMTKPEFTNNLKDAIQGEKVSKEYLSEIYDLIEAVPIQMFNDDESTNYAQETSSQAFHGILKNVQGTDSLLRGMAIHDIKFANINDFAEVLECTEKDALADLTRSIASKTWHQWYGVVNTCLETAHLDPQGIEPSVEILQYAVAVTVCLDMSMERSAFLRQLVRLRAFEQRRQGQWVSAPDDSHPDEAWHMQLEEDCSGLKDTKLSALQNIHGWIQSLKKALNVDVQNKVEMTNAVAELVDGDFLLHDPARCFLQSGNLIKKSARTGRSTEYRFYLFSDILLYASKEADGRYMIHEELPLHLMKIVDWFPPSQRNRQTMFEVHHPRKSFQVLCPSVEARKSWVDDIRATIIVELERKMKVESARLSVYNASR